MVYLICAWGVPALIRGFFKAFPGIADLNFFFGASPYHLIEILHLHYITNADAAPIPTPINLLTIAHSREEKVTRHTRVCISIGMRCFWFHFIRC